MPVEDFSYSDCDSSASQFEMSAEYAAAALSAIYDGVCSTQLFRQAEFVMSAGERRAEKSGVFLEFSTSFFVFCDFSCYFFSNPL